MGLLTVGDPLDHEETKEVSSYIRQHGIDQFIHTWNSVKNIADDELRFGDEIECGIYVVDSVNKTVKLSLRAAELRDILNKKERNVSHQAEGVTWHPEFGGWMIESTPSRPYTNYASDLLRVERNMILRRRRLLSALLDNEIAPTVTCYGLLGVGSFIDDKNQQQFSVPNSQSIYIPDYIINPHPRFAALTRNIRSRRGSKVSIEVPLYHDINTPEYQLYHNASIDSRSGSSSGSGNGNVHISEDDKEVINSKYIDVLEKDTNIHMDCMAFGMGMCCLQVTFQARDVDESRYMYDQLAVLSPIMLAMTAATPIFKGRISDRDARWDVIAQSCDDRNVAERGLVSEEEKISMKQEGIAGNGIQRVYKSRYDSVSTYIYHCKGDPKCKRTFDVYNDVPCPVDQDVKSRLSNAGVDENLAHHLAHLFTRDPLVAYHGYVQELDDTVTTEHFENIQSTNWQTCRWKPALSDRKSKLGWRTEFRPMELQLTDFENAAFTVFIALITRVLLSFDLALYIPLSKVDENMKRAQERDAINKNKFHFRKHVAPPDVEEVIQAVVPILSASASDTPTKSQSPSTSSSPTAKVASLSPPTIPPPSPCDCDVRYSLNENIGGVFSAETSCEEMTISEIFHGKGIYYPGLIPLVYAYLDYINCDAETYSRVDQYLQFISKRANGELITPATWIRQFVNQHPSYKHDSVVTQDILHDLLVQCQGIGTGNIPCPELLGDININIVRPDDAYGSLLAGRLSTEERSALAQKLLNKALQKK